MAATRLRLLAIPPEAASFSSLGFGAAGPCDAEVRGRLERVLEVFVEGYNLALARRGQDELAAALRGRFDPHHVGFAFEGAGMAYALLDLATPWRADRLAAFVGGPGRDHDYIAMVGAGFAIARLPWGRRRWPSYARRFDPLLAWCMADGYGFHQGVFAPGRYVRESAERAGPPAGLAPWARRLFDAGLGRSLWWSQVAVPRRIAQAIGSFAEERRAEMWCGIGTAAAYAGGAGDEALGELRELAGPYLPDLLSGVPFAARMRDRGGNPSPATDRACRLLLGRSPEAASRWLAGTVREAAADESIERHVRLRDAYLEVRRRLVEELRQHRKEAPHAS
jgi:enediyne biosynthesis protein E3